MTRPGADYFCVKPCIMVRNALKQFVQWNKTEIRSSSAHPHEHDILLLFCVVIQIIRADEALILNQLKPLHADKLFNCMI
jgi:hypothetical protein